MDSETRAPTVSAPSRADAHRSGSAPTSQPAADLDVLRLMTPATNGAAATITVNGRAKPAPPATNAPAAAPPAAARPRSWSARLRRLLALLLGSVLLLLVCVVLLAPPVVALAAGVWAAVTEVRAIAAIWTLAKAQQYGAVFAHLATLDAASRVAFLGVSFFALLFALMLLMSGLLGRRWARLFIAPGAIFTAPTLVLYFIGWLLITPVTNRMGVSPLFQTSVAVYALLDAIVLAAALCDMRPTLRRARRVAQLGAHTRPSLPAIRPTGRARRTPSPWRAPQTPPLPAVSDLADDLAREDAAYPSPGFALLPPVSRPMAAVRIEDVAKRATRADEYDDLDELTEAETWRIFSGEWAAWGAHDAAFHQAVTLPALDAPTAQDARNSANGASANGATFIGPTPVSPIPVLSPGEPLMDIELGAATAPVAPRIPAGPAPLTDLATLAPLVAVAEATALDGAPILNDIPLALAPAR